MIDTMAGSKNSKGAHVAPFPSASDAVDHVAVSIALMTTELFDKKFRAQSDAAYLARISNMREAWLSSGAKGGAQDQVRGMYAEALDRSELRPALQILFPGASAERLEEEVLLDVLTKFLQLKMRSASAPTCLQTFEVLRPCIRSCAVEYQLAAAAAPRGARDARDARDACDDAVIGGAEQMFVSAPPDDSLGQHPADGGGGRGGGYDDDGDGDRDGDRDGDGGDTLAPLPAAPPRRRRLPSVTESLAGVDVSDDEDVVENTNTRRSSRASREREIERIRAERVMRRRAREAEAMRRGSP